LIYELKSGDEPDSDQYWFDCFTYEDAVNGYVPSATTKLKSSAFLYNFYDIIQNSIIKVLLWFNPDNKSEWIVQKLVENDYNTLFKSR